MCCPRTSHHRSPGGKRRRKKKWLDSLPWKDERGHRQSDEHWNCFNKGNVGEASERQVGEYTGFSEITDTILNWTEVNEQKWRWVLPLSIFSFFLFSFSLLSNSGANTRRGPRIFHEQEAVVCTLAMWTGSDIIRDMGCLCWCFSV